MGTPEEAAASIHASIKEALNTIDTDPEHAATVLTVTHATVKREAQAIVRARSNVLAAIEAIEDGDDDEALAQLADAVGAYDLAAALLHREAVA